MSVVKEVIRKGMEEGWIKFKKGSKDKSGNTDRKGRRRKREGGTKEYERKTSRGNYIKSRGL